MVAETTSCSNQTVAGLKWSCIASTAYIEIHGSNQTVAGLKSRNLNDEVLRRSSSNQTVAGLKCLWVSRNPPLAPCSNQTVAGLKSGTRFCSRTRCSVQIRPLRDWNRRFSITRMRDIIVQIRPLRDWNEEMQQGHYIVKFTFKSDRCGIEIEHHNRRYLLQY